MARRTQQHEQIIEQMLGYAQARRAQRVTASTRTNEALLRPAA